VELVVTRNLQRPGAHRVSRRGPKPELLKRWWAPKSFGVSFLSCEADVRTGGMYRFRVSATLPLSSPMEFFGRYLESDAALPASSGRMTKVAKGGAVTTGDL